MVPRSSNEKKKREIKVEQFKRIIFQNFQKRDQYCDITVLSTDGVASINAHRVILAAKMNNFEACSTDSPVLQTTMDATILRKIVNFCYTDEVCFEGVSQTFALLKFAMAYDITDLIEKCRAYLNETIAATPSSPEPSMMPQKLIIFGPLCGENRFSAAMLETMDGNWMELAEIIGSQKYTRPLTSVAYCGDDCVVVSGGLDGMTSKQQVHLIDLKSKKIKILPPMKTGRCEHASIVYNNCLYAAGGMKSGVHLDSVEKFDLERRRWTSVKPMRTKRTLFSMVVAHGLLYTIGGENEFECMNAVEYYDPKRNVWQSATPMIKARASAGVAVFNNAIYAVGGSTIFKYGDTDTVERYDFHTKQWSLIASLNHSRYNVACCVYQNCLIAAGGYDFASHAVNYLEIYDEKTNKWIWSKAMNKARGRCQMFVTSSTFDTTQTN